MSAPEVVTRVGHVGGVTTDLLITRYCDKTLVCVTQLGKFGSWLHIEKDTCRVGDTCQSDSPVYTCTVLLGQESEELHFLGRTLAETIDLTKPVILTVGVKNLTVQLALELVNFIKDNIKQ